MAPQPEDQWHGASALHCWHLARYLARAAWTVDRQRMPLEDYLSVAHEGLARAYHFYNSSHGISFMLYVKWRVRQALTDWRRQALGDRRIAPEKQHKGYARREQSLEAMLETEYEESSLVTRLRRKRALGLQLPRIAGEESAVLAGDLWGKCMTGLSPAQRDVMDRVLAGEGGAEISQETGRAKGTIDATIFQARQRVKRWWRREELRCARYLAS